MGTWWGWGAGGGEWLLASLDLLETESLGLTRLLFNIHFEHSF